MKPYLSTGAFRTRSLPEILRQCAELGINHLELSSGVAYQPGLLDTVRSAPRTAMRFLVHNYFPPPAESFVLNLASSDPQILRRSLEFCKAAIDLSAELGAPFYSAHSGFAFNLTPEMLGKPEAQSKISASQSYEAAYAAFLESARMLAGYAASRGLKFLIENNVVSPRYLERAGANALLMSTAEEIVRFLQDANDPNLRLLVDVGHVNVSATALHFEREQFIERVAPYIEAIHLSGNDGVTDANQPFDASAWFFPLLKEFVLTPLVIEVYHLSPGQIQAQYRALEGI